MKGTANMKSFMILVTVAIFGQILAFTIADHFFRYAETLVPEGAVGPLAPSFDLTTLNMSSIPTVYTSANKFYYKKI
jgi:hypothetical protein